MASLRNACGEHALNPRINAGEGLLQSMPFCVFLDWEESRAFLSVWF